MSPRFSEVTSDVASVSRVDIKLFTLCTVADTLVTIVIRVTNVDLGET